MAQITKGSQYIAFALYSLCYCCWGSRPALSSGGDETAFRNARSPNSCSRLSLNLITGPQTKHQKGKTDGADPRPKKKKKKEKRSSGVIWWWVFVIPFGFVDGVGVLSPFLLFYTLLR